MGNTVLIAVLLFYGLGAVAQVTTGSQEPPCVASGETVYHPGEDHVKPPELHRERLGPDNKGRIRPNSRVSLELTVNSIGAICEVRALKAPTREKAVPGSV
jgi:hypothetical protein